MKIRSSYGLVALLPAMAVVVIAVGIGRYGSLENFRHRIEAELMAWRPHPQFVPTPLPYRFDGIALSARAAAVSAAPPRPIETPMSEPGQPQPAPDPASPATATPAAPALATATPAALAAAVAIHSVPVRPVVPTITASPVGATSPTPEGQPIVTPGSAASGLPCSARISGLTHIWQTWNNCGPATLAMNLSYFGDKVGQKEIGAFLRPDPNDKNVSLDEMAAYARSRGLAASVRVDGDFVRLRRLIVAGVPVLIETWHEAKPNDGMGHYRLLVGYDDASGSWIAYDSYDARDVVKGQPYTGIRLPYEEIDRLWAVFNRQYLVIYDAAHAQAVESILGEDRDEAALWPAALAHAEAAVRENPDDPFAWFNLGSDLVALGRFAEAAQAYDRARQIGLPWRMLWYQFGPFRAYYETGRYDEVIALANATIATAQQAEEMFFWRGLAHNAKGDKAAARASWQRALELNPHYADAAAALATLDQPQTIR